jgi:hypothetical protein
MKFRGLSDYENVEHRATIFRKKLSLYSTMPYVYLVFRLTCEIKIAMKEIPGNKKWQLGGFNFERHAIVVAEGLKK